MYVKKDIGNENGGIKSDKKQKIQRNHDTTRGANSSRGTIDQSGLEVGGRKRPVRGTLIDTEKEQADEGDKTAGKNQPSLKCRAFWSGLTPLLPVDLLIGIKGEELNLLVIFMVAAAVSFRHSHLQLYSIVVYIHRKRQMRFVCVLGRRVLEIPLVVPLDVSQERAASRPYSTLLSEDS
ncbi:hypothetical protein KQX54_001325 [Cotesia glomerata]|uniref:Uncharacterized protein n=1 Tax=Cotesia glomerata TaxID=32391 RepID=A0AAV7HW41_COTGL|nr:hypothetical protein KQX54_001325 [Cotesia glomerata]